MEIPQLSMYSETDPHNNPLDHKLRVSHSSSWSVSDDQHLYQWLATMRDRAQQNDSIEHPCLLSLVKLYSIDRMAKQQMNAMVSQLPAPVAALIPSIDMMFKMLDAIMMQATEFRLRGHAGSPLNTILDFPLSTPAGQILFKNNNIKHELKTLLYCWCRTMTEDSEDATTLSALNRVTTTESIIQSMDRGDYEPNPDRWGFRTWKAFFMDAPNVETE